LETRKSDKDVDAKVVAKDGISRRVFVGGMAAAASAMIVPRHVLGGPGYTAPSDKLNIAAVGVSGMGANNIRQCATENIVALCDVDDERSAKVYSTYPNAKTYRDFRIMLEKEKGIEAVIVATPDHNHAVVAMACMKLGKHVYVQKPLTRTIWEARMLTEAAHKYNVVTQMGNQGHSGEGVRLIEEWIADGAIGKVHEVHSWTNRPIWPQGMPRPTDTPPVPATLDWDLWIGPAPMRPYNPAYHPFSWRSWWDFGAGALGDMGCHVMDATYTALKLGSPTTVEATIAYQFVPPAPGQRGYGRRLTYHDSFPMATLLHYTFPARGKKYPAVQYHWYDGGLLPRRPDELEPDRKLPESGTIFVGEKGKLMCETYSESPRLIPETRMKAYKRPKKTIPRVKGSHEQNWIEACKNKTEATSDFDYAGPFTETVLLGNLAVWFAGQRLEWDGPNMKVTNFPEANELVKREFRQGWSL
jgi:predicted dehydrogenase